MTSWCERVKINAWRRLRRRRGQPMVDSGNINPAEYNTGVFSEGKPDNLAAISAEQEEEFGAHQKHART